MPLFSTFSNRRSITATKSKVSTSDIGCSVLKRFVQSSRRTIRTFYTLDLCLRGFVQFFTKLRELSNSQLNRSSMNQVGHNRSLSSGNLYRLGVNRVVRDPVQIVREVEKYRPSNLHGPRALRAFSTRGCRPSEIVEQRRERRDRSEESFSWLRLFRKSPCDLVAARTP